MPRRPRHHTIRLATPDTSVQQFIQARVGQSRSAWKQLPTAVKNLVAPSLHHQRAVDSSLPVYTWVAGSQSFQTTGTYPPGHTTSDFFQSRVQLDSTQDGDSELVTQLVEAYWQLTSRREPATARYLSVRDWVSQNPTRYRLVADLVKHPNSSQQQEIYQWNQSSRGSTDYPNIRQVPLELPVHLLAECRLASDQGLLDRLELLKTDGFGGNTRVQKHLKSRHRRQDSRVSHTEFRRDQTKRWG